MSIKLGDELGRGGYGTVYAIKDNSKLCVKISNKNGTNCRKWSNEFIKITSMISLLKDNQEYNKIKRVKIVIPSEFLEYNNNNTCYMKLPRIYRPNKDNNKPTIQAQLGVLSLNLIHKSRGEFIGLIQIKEYLNNAIRTNVNAVNNNNTNANANANAAIENNNVDDILNTVCIELGKMMALIHYLGKNDAYDIELYFGKEYNGKILKFYIADFDLTENITKYDTETIERIAWSLDAIPFFPLKSVDENLYNIFKNAYSTTASSVSSEPTIIEIVKEVFKNYG